MGAAASLRPEPVQFPLCPQTQIRVNSGVNTTSAPRRAGSSPGDGAGALQGNVIVSDVKHSANCED